MKRERLNLSLEYFEGIYLMTEFEPLLLPPHESNYPYTISEVNDTIGSVLESIAGVIWVEGEIADIKIAGSGHCYLRLRDDESQIPAVMWKGTALQHELSQFECGMDVSIIAVLRVYRKGGYYQLDIKKMQPAGISAAQIAFEKMKEKLHSEGLFNEEHKLPIPESIKQLGVVTAKTGAALWDIVNVVNKRSPSTDILLASTSVQGENAPQEIAEAINRMNKYNEADCLIVGRGGGSADDLSAFNDERVVRAIFNSKIPVISAVGHEIDVTLSDLVADLRAPTPSAAAELAVSDTDSSQRYYNQLSQRFSLNFKTYINGIKERYKRAADPGTYELPMNMIRDYRQTIDTLSDDLSSGFNSKFKDCKRSVSVAAGKLNALSPLSILSRGYSVVTDKTGSTIKDAALVNKDDLIDITLKKGKLEAKVTKIIAT